MKEIYFDNSATTKVLKSAADIAYKVMTEEYGNPSSVHGKGVNATNILNEARSAVLSSLGVRPRGNYSVFSRSSGRMEISTAAPRISTFRQSVACEPSRLTYPSVPRRCPYLIRT